MTGGEEASFQQHTGKTQDPVQVCDHISSIFSHAGTSAVWYVWYYGESISLL